MQSPSSSAITQHPHLLLNLIVFLFQLQQLLLYSMRAQFFHGLNTQILWHTRSHSPPPIPPSDSGGRCRPLLPIPLTPISCSETQAFTLCSAAASTGLPLLQPSLLRFFLLQRSPHSHDEARKDYCHHPCALKRLAEM